MRLKTDLDAIFVQRGCSQDFFNLRRSRLAIAEAKALQECSSNQRRGSKLLHRNKRHRANDVPHCNDAAAQAEFNAAADAC